VVFPDGTTGTVYQQYQYTFDYPGRTAAGNLAGQDNWTVSSGAPRLAVEPDGNAKDYSSGLCTTIYGGTTIQTATRINNANWSYSLATLPRSDFFIQWTLAVDTSTASTSQSGNFQIGNGTNSLGLGILVNNTGSWSYDPTIYDARTSGNTTRHGWDGAWKAYPDYFQLALHVRPDGLAGEGLGTYYFRKGTTTGDGTTTWAVSWTAIANLTDINLKLDTAVTGPDKVNLSTFDRMRISEQRRTASFDDLTILIPAPEPAAMSLLALGGVGIVLRRRRRA
jgi:hypothetical protein